MFMDKRLDVHLTGNNIKEIMRKKNKTVKEASVALGGISLQAIYHWQSGRSVPSLDNLVKLAIFLEEDMDDLLVGVPLDDPSR